MPIEIKELIIKATVDENTPNSEGSYSTNQNQSSGSSKHMQAELLDQVTNLINRQKER